MQTLSDLLPVDYCHLLLGNVLDHERDNIQKIAERKVGCLINLLGELTLFDSDYSSRIAKIDNVFTQYHTCLDWLQDLYASKLSKDKVFSMYVNEEIAREHDYAKTRRFPLNATLNLWNCSSLELSLTKQIMNVQV